MKKLFTLILSIIFITLCLFACKNSEYAKEQEAKQEAIYNKGHKAGYEEGYWAGIKEAQEYFGLTEEEIARYADDLHGLSPEEAVMILDNYADGEPISKQDVYKAIWTIRRYYYDMQEAIHDIDSYIP